MTSSFKICVGLDVDTIGRTTHVHMPGLVKIYTKNTKIAQMPHFKAFWPHRVFFVSESLLTTTKTTLFVPNIL